MITLFNQRGGIFMQKTISKDTALSEVTLRKYERTSTIDDRDLVRKLCLSVGLLQPGDSRDVIVDVLYVLLRAKKNQKKLTSTDIEKSVISFRKKKKLAMYGIAGSNIRRQIKRLRDLFLVEKVTNNYRITEFVAMKDTFEEKFEKYLLPSIITRIKEFIDEVDQRF